MAHNAFALIPEINVNHGNSLMGSPVFISLVLAPKAHNGMALIVHLIATVPLDIITWVMTVNLYLKDVFLPPTIIMEDAW